MRRRRRGRPEKTRLREAFLMLPAAPAWRNVRLRRNIRAPKIFAAHWS
jgi:hypothetical protein